MQLAYRRVAPESRKRSKLTVAFLTASLATPSSAPAISYGLAMSVAPPTSEEVSRTIHERQKTSLLTQGVIVDVLGEARAMSC